MHQTFEQRVHMYLWILAVLLPLVGLYVADWRRRSRQLFRQVDGVHLVWAGVGSLTDGRPFLGWGEPGKYAKTLEVAVLVTSTDLVVRPTGFSRTAMGLGETWLARDSLWGSVERGHDGLWPVTHLVLDLPEGAVRLSLIRMTGPFPMSLIPLVRPFPSESDRPAG